MTYNLENALGDRSFFGNCGTVASDISFSNLTAEKVFAACGIHYIKVPRKPQSVTFGPLPDLPVIHRSGLCKNDQAYIIAGFGVVAGKDAFDRLNGHSYLKWVDEFDVVKP